MPAPRQPLQQPRFGRRQVRIGDADRLEAEFPAPLADALREGSLVAVLQDMEPILVPVNVVHHEGRHATQKVRAFLDLAIETLRANPALH